MIRLLNRPKPKGFIPRLSPDGEEEYLAGWCLSYEGGRFHPGLGSHNAVAIGSINCVEHCPHKTACLQLRIYKLENSTDDPLT
jgi:hypothetical protein